MAFEIRTYDGESEEIRHFNDIEEAADVYKEFVESKKYETVAFYVLLKHYNVWDKYLGQ